MDDSYLLFLPPPPHLVALFCILLQPQNARGGGGGRADIGARVAGPERHRFVGWWAPREGLAQRRSHEGCLMHPTFFFFFLFNVSTLQRESLEGIDELII